MVKIEELFINTPYSYMLEDLRYIAESGLKFSSFRNKTVLVVGNTDSVGEWLTLSMLFRNDIYGDNINVISIGNIKQYDRSDLLAFDSLFEGFEKISERAVDYIIYFSSNDESEFKSKPGSALEQERMIVSSLMALAVKKNSRVLFISPMEVYGSVRNGFKPIEESETGYISIADNKNLVGLAARMDETLAYSFSEERNISISFARLPIVYGNYGSSIFSFGSEIFKLLLDSKRGSAELPKLPDEKMSVVYIADCVRAVLFLLVNGKRCEVYNIAFENNIVTFRDILNIADKICGRAPSFGGAEESSYMTPCRVLDGGKLYRLGLRDSLNSEQGIKLTLIKFKAEGEVSK